MSRPNVIWTGDGPLLIDFEASCTGPLEWDLAYLPDEARNAFPDRDEALIERLRAAVSYCVAAWCWADPEPTHEGGRCGQAPCRSTAPKLVG